MSTEQQAKTSSQDKKHRIENIKLLLTKQHNLTSAQQICDAYSKQFPEEAPIPLPSMSRYLASSDFERYNGIYRVTLKDDEEKKSQILSNLLKDSNAQIINEYDILFIRLSNDFSPTIAHYIETHPKISNYILGIVHYNKSLMIFCEPNNKPKIKETIDKLINH